jgi:phospholipase D1/2
MREGDNVWRIAHADRVAFLIDGESYYGAVAHAVAKARSSVFLLGWDVHSNVELLRGDSRDRLPARLGPRFAALLRNNRDLHVCVLDWDYPVILSQDRESRLRFFNHWPRGPRFHLEYDSFHPTGASHHQKIVLVDDSLVFCGGMDIGVGRWDTSEHRARDRRRSDPKFSDYAPAHDIMAMAEGEIARAMGELVRERWQRATQLPAPVPRVEGRADCWPDGVEADLTDCEIGITRTQPEHEGQRAIREVERLYVDSIAEAQRRIYIENQYLTCDSVVDALAARLREADGPEMVITLPRNNFGYFEAQSIQVLHFRCIERLRKADLHDRLRICYPRIPELDDKQVNLHSKVMTIDDEMLRIGSSNMANRSMRLDTECDFAIESCGERRIEKAVASFRNRLLAEHLCLTENEVERALEGNGSMKALVDENSRRSRCLGKVEPASGQLDADYGTGIVVDPAEPLSAEVVIEAFSSDEARRRAKPRLARLAAMILLFVALAAAWQWTPLSDVFDPAVAASLGERFGGHPLAPFVLIGAYVASAFLVVPVTIMILATASVFGPWLGVVYSLAGSLASAMTMFAIGRVLGRGTVESLTGRQYRRVADGLRHRGLPTMIVLRMLPVAPFSIVNMVVGATGIGVRDFALGTAIGMSPGIVSLCVFQAQLLEAFRRPDAGNFAMLALLAIGIGGALAWLRSRLRAKRPGGPRGLRRLVPRQG